MPELVLLNPRQYVAGLDLSGSYSQHALVLDADAVQFTAFGDFTRTYKGGLVGAGSEHSGFWDDPVDSDLFTNLAAAARNTTLSPDGGDEGDVAFFFSSIGTKYEPGAAIGDAFAFSNSNQVTGIVTRGLIFQTGVETTSGNGTAFNLGTLDTGKKLRASLHVLSASAADTLDVVVASDSQQAFGGTPETRITFPQRSAIGGELLTVDGPHADTWYRVQYTIAGTDPSFSFVVAVGIA
jgi:hypothetical protein